MKDSNNNNKMFTKEGIVCTKNSLVSQMLKNILICLLKLKAGS